MTVLADVFRQTLQHTNQIMLFVFFIAYPALLIAMIILPIMSCFGRIEFWSLAFSNAVFCYWLAYEAADRDDRLGLGILISFAAIALFLICFALGATISTFRRRKTTSNRSADILFAITVYCPIPLIILFPLGIFARWPGFFIVSLLIFLAGALVCLAFFTASGKRPMTFDRFGLSCLLLSGTLILSIAIADVSATAVWTEAARTAEGHRYCLQSGNRPVTTLSDASVLTFRERKYGGSGPRYLQNHGLLIVDAGDERHVFGWSYRKTKFTSESLNDSPDRTARPKIACTPQQRSSLKP